eukprot:scaffold130598_cov96-Phaeocystis_antarctica.AAC.1
MGRVDLSERLLAQALVMRERGGAVVHRVGRSRGARNVSRGCELSRGSQATCCRRACRPSAPRFKPTTKILCCESRHSVAGALAGRLLHVSSQQPKFRHSVRNRVPGFATECLDFGTGLVPHVPGELPGSFASLLGRSGP